MVTDPFQESIVRSQIMQLDYARICGAIRLQDSGSITDHTTEYLHGLMLVQL